MNYRSNKGDAGATVLVVLAVLAFGWFFAKPKFLDGDSRRAKASQESTARVEEAVAAQSSTAAASVVKIGEANSMAPESPARDFISREIPAALSLLPAPNAAALIEAERRRSAVMEGRLQEANALYQSEAKRAAQLQHERDEAFAARRAADLALSEAAAARLASERQRNAFILLAVLIGALWIYAKVYSIGPASLGRIAADVRAGTSPIAAMDTHLAPWMHSRVKRHAKLSAKETE